MKRYRKNRLLYFQIKKPALAKKYKFLIWLGVGLSIVGFYLYYWYIYLDKVSDVDIEKGKSDYSEIYEEESFDDEKYHQEKGDVIDKVEIEGKKTALSLSDINDHVSLDMDFEYQFDINQIIHTHRLLVLEKYCDQSKPDELQDKDVVIGNINKAKIAIVIDDMGASIKRTNEIIAINAPITASFVTFANNLKSQVNKSKKAGHEIMIHVPMQPKADIFVSDDVLTTDMSNEKISSIFNDMLSKFEGVKGINNHMGSKFTEYADKLDPLMKILSEHKLFFLDSKTTSKSQVEKVAKKHNVQYATRNVFLDNENNLEYILGQLEKTEKIALKHGYAIAIGHPKSQTSKALEIWLKTLKDKNLEVVHLSQIVENMEDENDDKKVSKYDF